MKCAVAIVLAIIGMAMAHPHPVGISLAHSPLVLPSAVSVTSSVINHGVTLPRLHIAPVITAPIITAPIITAPIIKYPAVSWGGLGHGWH